MAVSFPLFVGMKRDPGPVLDGRSGRAGRQRRVAGTGRFGSCALSFSASDSMAVPLK
jgi:hypothetical protein